MKVLITGTASGIGYETALLFLKNGHDVFGIDINPTAINPAGFSGKYTHFKADISVPESLPEIDGIQILINNAGIQSGTDSDIKVNLLGTMAVTKKYAFQKEIKSVLFISSVSAMSGNEFPEYVASKAGINGYMKNCAILLANKYRATCNALCFGGVLTELNNPVTKDEKLWQKIMDVTPLKKWATAEEAAKWCHFMTAENTFCTGQAIDISGGERNCMDLFVWPEEKKTLEN